MNKVILMGRLTRDPEVRYTQGEKSTCIANFSLAVDRRFKTEDQSADFIQCVAFGKLGEHVERYYRKGMKTGIVGRIQTRNYTNRDNQKVYVTEVVVEEMEFAESKSAQAQSYGQPQQNHTAPAQTYGAPAQDSGKYDDFMNIPDNLEEDLPFN